MPLNRGIRDEEGHLQDIIAGDFFICYAPLESERFLAMPEELEKKYMEMFELPEMFMMGYGEIDTVQYDPSTGSKLASAKKTRGDAGQDYAR